MAYKGVAKICSVWVRTRRRTVRSQRSTRITTICRCWCPLRSRQAVGPGRYVAMGSVSGPSHVQTNTLPVSVANPVSLSYPRDVLHGERDTDAHNHYLARTCIKENLPHEGKKGRLYVERGQLLARSDRNHPAVSQGWRIRSRPISMYIGAQVSRYAGHIRKVSDLGLGAR